MVVTTIPPTPQTRPLAHLRFRCERVPVNPEQRLRGHVHHHLCKRQAQAARPGSLARCRRHFQRDPLSHYVQQVQLRQLLQTLLGNVCYCLIVACKTQQQYEWWWVEGAYRCNAG